MNALDDFETGLDRWGGTLARWPDEARRAAETLLAGSPEARARHDAMLRMEVALVLPALALPASDDLESGRFAARATRSPQGRAPLLARAPPMVRRAGWGAAVAAALILGIMAGEANLGSHEDSADQVLASALSPSAGPVDVD